MSLDDIIWTRAAEDWPQDEPLFSDRPPLRMPCVAFESIPAPKSAVIGFDVVLVTNLRTAKLLKNYSGIAEAKVICFGRAAFLAMTKYCDNVVLIDPSLRTIQDALGLLSSSLRGKTVLLPGPCERAFDLRSALATQGVFAKNLDLYRCKRELCFDYCEHDSIDFIFKFKGVICFASPSALISLFDYLAPRLPPKHLKAAVIGPSTARASGNYFQNLYIAKENSFAALVALAQKLRAAT